MTSLAPTLQAFFTTRLSSQYGASPHTVAAYPRHLAAAPELCRADHETQPVDLDLGQINADLINGFLTSLEAEPGQQHRHPQRLIGMVVSAHPRSSAKRRHRNRRSPTAEGHPRTIANDGLCKPGDSAVRRVLAGVAPPQCRHPINASQQRYYDECAERCAGGEDLSTPGRPPCLPISGTCVPRPRRDYESAVGD